MHLSQAMCKPFANYFINAEHKPLAQVIKNNPSVKCYRDG